VTTETLIKNAKKAYERKEYRQAAKLFSSIAESIPESDDPMQKAEMQNNSSVSWLLAGEPEKALEACLNTDVVFAQGNDIRKQAISLGNQAAAYEALGDTEMAIEKFQVASDLLKEIGDESLRAYVLQNLSGLQLKSGDQFASIATMHTALENKEKLSLKEKFLKKLLRIPFKMMR